MRPRGPGLWWTGWLAGWQAAPSPRAHGRAPGATSRHLCLEQPQLSPQALEGHTGLTREEGRGPRAGQQDLAFAPRGRVSVAHSLSFSHEPGQRSPTTAIY